jgi:uncharacterized protein YbjT (DUF2867 family)
VNRSNFKHYKSAAHTDYKEFEGRSHFAVGQHGWEEVADYALAASRGEWHDPDAMKIIVIGGHGRVGSKLVETLGEEGHEAVAASRRTGVDAFTGEGLAEALEGARAIIDACNSPSFEDDAVMEFFRTTTANLLAAGEGHHVVVSIVGCHRLTGSGYMRAKVAQEQLIGASSNPYTIVRTTQFHEFVGTIADVATDGDTVRVPPASIQPLSARDAARAVGRIAVGEPLRRIVEVGGPEAFGFDALMRQVAGTRHVVTDPDARYFGAELADADLLPGRGAEFGEMRFEDWLSEAMRADPRSEPSLRDTGGVPS